MLEIQITLQFWILIKSHGQWLEIQFRRQVLKPPRMDGEHGLRHWEDLLMSPAQVLAAF